MQENRVSIKISQTDLQSLLDAVKTINTILSPYLVALTPDDRRTLPKMSDGTLPFVQKALEYAKSNKQFVPSFVDVGELQIDVDATAALLQVQHPLDQITESLDHTVMLCGSEAYVAALAFYNSIKQAAKMKVPGAESIFKDLSLRFNGKVKKSAAPDLAK